VHMWAWCAQASSSALLAYTGTCHTPSVCIR
jgi:hypothetical protein